VDLPQWTQYLLAEISPGGLGSAAVLFFATTLIYGFRAIAARRKINVLDEQI
jgi:hypothetical protein